MTYKIKKEKPIYIKEPYGLPQDLTPTGTFKVEKKIKKDKKKLFLEEIKKKDTITEQEILLIKRRLNDGTYSIADINEITNKKLTSEQTKKGLAWLKNKGWGKTGKERSTTPYGYREENVIKSFEKIELIDFNDNVNYTQAQMGIHNYQPVYAVIGKEGRFEYYTELGEPKIIG